jgi:hypothetical protein
MNDKKVSSIKLQRFLAKDYEFPPEELNAIVLEVLRRRERSAHLMAGSQIPVIRYVGYNGNTYPWEYDSTEISYTCNIPGGIRLNAYRIDKDNAAPGWNWIVTFSNGLCSMGWAQTAAEARIGAEKALR